MRTAEQWADLLVYDKPQNFTLDNQHAEIIRKAMHESRLEGCRMGLEAADTALCNADFSEDGGKTLHDGVEIIRALSPADIIKGGAE